MDGTGLQSIEDGVLHFADGGRLTLLAGWQVESLVGGWRISEATTGHGFVLLTGQERKQVLESCDWLLRQEWLESRNRQGRAPDWEGEAFRTWAKEQKQQLRG